MVAPSSDVDRMLAVLAGEIVDDGRSDDPGTLSGHLEVPAGGVCALFGTNGAGKSTIVRAVSGLIRPSAGTVCLFGDDVTSVKPEARVGLGMVAVPGGDVFASVMAKWAIERGGHVRVGLEDHAADRKPTNLELVEQAVALCEKVGRPVASCDEAARVMDLPSSRSAVA